MKLADIRLGYVKMAEHRSFRPGLRAICDLRSAELDLSGEDMRVLAALVRAVAPKWGKTKWLALVASDAAYGLLRMFMSLTDSSPIATLVVRDPAEAGDWLELGVSLDFLLDGPPGAGAEKPCSPCSAAMG